jgi:hypothetical protein
MRAEGVLRVSPIRRMRALVSAAVAVLLVGAASAQAGTFPATNLNDTGPGSLRQAITDANASSDPNNTIPISATGQIQLQSELPPLQRSMQIQGPGSASLDVHRSTSGEYRVLETAGSGATITITGLTISNGFVSANQGGGLFNFAGNTLTLRDVVVEGNTASGGSGGDSGGINNYTGATLTLINSRVIGNTASGGGGGIGNTGTLTVINSTISGNKASIGGGVLTDFATATFDSSTISGNQALTAGGGGIQSDGTGASSSPPQLTLTNSTVANNTAAQFGGGINTVDEDVSPTAEPTTTLASSTVVGNHADIGGGLAQAQSNYVVRNSLIAHNVATASSPDCQNGGADVYGSQGYNLIGTDAGCTGFTGAGDQVNVANPLIGPLASNGGPTQTIALLSGSPAIHRGNPATPGSGGAACPATDQRGLPRGGLAGRCDIGAFQVQTPTLSGLRISPHESSLAGRKVKGRCVKQTAKNKSHPSCRRPINFQVTFTLNTTGTVTMTVSGSAHGRKVKGRCVKQTKKNSGKQKCKRTVKLPGSIAVGGKAGATTFTFNGKIGGKTLEPGNYTLTATTAGGSESVTFKLTK